MTKQYNKRKEIMIKRDDGSIDIDRNETGVNYDDCKL